MVIEVIVSIKSSMNSCLTCACPIYGHNAGDHCSQRHKYKVFLYSSVQIFLMCHYILNESDTCSKGAHMTSPKLKSKFFLFFHSLETSYTWCKISFKRTWYLHERQFLENTQSISKNFCYKQIAWEALKYFNNKHVFFRDPWNDYAPLPDYRRVLSHVSSKGSLFFSISDVWATFSVETYSASRQWSGNDFQPDLTIVYSTALSKSYLHFCSGQLHTIENTGSSIVGFFTSYFSTAQP